MCGITGYVGNKNAVPILLEGLLKLEYRGYDSAGIALLKNGVMRVCKKKGRVGTLAEEVGRMKFSANTGISHTRWATHGGVTDANAHPHVSSDGNFALVHNGIIENYEGIKNFLSTKGYSFSSQTDSEALVNLIAYHYAHRTEDDAENRFMEAVRKALLHVEGTYGIAVLCRFNDGEIVAARKGSPLLIGVGRNERLVSSDVLGFAGRASNVIYLEDNQIASVTADNCDIVTIGNKPVSYTVGEIDWKLESAELGDCRHFMQKEIMEQPTVLENAIRGRISDDNSTAVLNGLNMTPTQMRQIDRILFCACGTAWHACLVAEYLIEKYARIPVEVEYASEFRYRNAPLDKNTLVFVISQSGETIDTLEALRESKRKGFKTLAITNSVGSTISRESDGGLYQYAGKEVGVASTKAFTSQIAICLLIALYIGRMRDLSFSDGRAIVDAIKSLPAVVAQVLKLAPQIEKIAKKYAKFSDFLFVGRLSEFPVALEGALKLKEISYIHAEGYPAAEMKHGPIALVSPECPSVVFATSDEILSKVVSNAQEIKARKGPIIAVTDRPEAFEGIADDIVAVPKVHDCIKTVVATIPIQLLAYYVALERGCDVDKPRNLAKAVTVE
ncbi:MAG: glutamine--fructose-6-phosphate aminotransferase [Verrucomicrobia bacterium CAG:312_58_20]|nr:MAG: glutamine--fructose-6-phosphate aminotransferase [Verrucomicrobia bacterium CAG:312_58_20]